MTGLSASVNVLFSNQYADITTKHTTLQDELWKILVANLYVRLMEITKGCFFCLRSRINLFLLYLQHDLVNLYFEGGPKNV